MCKLGDRPKPLVEKLQEIEDKHQMLREEDVVSEVDQMKNVIREIKEVKEENEREKKRLQEAHDRKLEGDRKKAEERKYKPVSLSFSSRRTE